MEGTAKGNNTNRTLENVISKIAEKEGFASPKITTTGLNSDGANYLGELYFVDVEEEGKQALHLFGKVTNVPEQARAVIAANTIYRNEVFMYTIVANAFQEMQEKHDVPYEKRFVFPKYYGSNLQELEEVVVLENLAAEGYVVFNRMKAYDWEYAKSAVEELAKFHALSFALKYENPERFEKIKNSLKNAMAERLINHPEMAAHMLMLNIHNIEDENKTLVKNYLEENKDNLLIKYINPNSNAVIIHGDYRASNILVKYKGDSIVSLKPVDYQTAMYGNPVNDLIYLLFTGSDESFRKKYFDQFFEHYYNCLGDFLKLLSQDIRNIYPNYAFYFDVKDTLGYGLELGLSVLSMILVETKNKPNVGDMVSEEAANETLEKVKPSELYVERLNAIVTDIKRWGILTNDSPKLHGQQFSTTCDETNQIVHVENIVTSIAEKEGYLNFKVEITPISSNGASYVGDLFLGNVSEQAKDTLKLFIKMSNVPAETRKFIRISELYKNEVFTYTTVAKEYHQLQERHGVPKEKQFRFVKYYGSNLSYMEELVVLENLAAHGYELKDRFTKLDWEYAKAALEEVAKFHALSFAVKTEKPEVFKRIKRGVRNILKENMRKVADSTGENIIHKSLGIVETENKMRWKKFVDENKDKFMCLQFDVMDKYGVIVHGDYRVSNILHKIEGDTITSLKPIDYQTVYYGSPVQDIIYFLFLGSDESFRRQYFDQCLEHYYTSLGGHLKLLSQDVNVLYPKSVFYFDLKDRLLRSGLDATLFVLPTVLVQPGKEAKLADMVDEDGMKDTYEKATPNEVYNERFNGIVRDLVRWGLLKE